jgi:hypothetical protein
LAVGCRRQNGQLSAEILITVPGLFSPYHPSKQSAQIGWTQPFLPPQARRRWDFFLGEKHRLQVPDWTRREEIHLPREARRAGVLWRGLPFIVRVTELGLVREGRTATLEGRSSGATEAVEMVWKRERFVKGAGMAASSLRRRKAVPFSRESERAVVGTATMVVLGLVLQAGQVKVD